MVVIRSWTEGDKSWCLIDLEFWFCKMEGVMKITCITVLLYLTLLNWTLKTIIMESFIFGATIKRLGDEDFMGTCTYWVASMQQMQALLSRHASTSSVWFLHFPIYDPTSELCFQGRGLRRQKSMKQAFPPPVAFPLIFRKVPPPLRNGTQ